ncbi:hypothetical protein Tco_0688930 [Tanacetum coccineum]
MITDLKQWEKLSHMPTLRRANDKEETKAEVKDEDSTRKRNLGTKKKMKSRKRRYIKHTSSDDTNKENEELRLCLKIATDMTKKQINEDLDRKYPSLREDRVKYNGIKCYIIKKELLIENLKTRPDGMGEGWSVANHHTTNVSNSPMLTDQKNWTKSQGPKRLGKDISNPLKLIRLAKNYRFCSAPGECEGEDVILEGEVEGSVTSSIVGNRGTSWPEYPFVGLFMLLKTLLLREGTGYVLECC